MAAQPTGNSVAVSAGSSLSTDPTFAAVKATGEKWLKSEKRTEMDSVNFNKERFELLIDARGYRPEDLKCFVQPLLVQMDATRKEGSTEPQRSFTVQRRYQLQQPVKPDQAICCLSSDGILLVAVPWQ